MASWELRVEGKLLDDVSRGRRCLEGRWFVWVSDLGQTLGRFRGHPGAQLLVQRWEVCVVVTALFLQMAVECPEEGVPLLIPVLYWLTPGLPRAPVRASGLTFPHFFQGLRILST